MNLVRALIARDDGNDEAARAFLAEAGRRLRTPSLVRALGEAPSEWPRALRMFLTDVPDTGASPDAGGS